MRKWNTITLDFFGIGRRQRTNLAGMTLQPRNSASQLLEMEIVRQKLKELVSLGWTYGVLWKIGPDRRTPVWYQGYFNESMQVDISQKQQFESVYRHCRFTPTRPGYAYIAWHRQAPCWWTGHSEPVLTDENKEMFLRVCLYSIESILRTRMTDS